MCAGNNNRLAVDDQGRVTFEVVGSGLIAADLELSRLMDRIAGQEPRYALPYLWQKLPLREMPAIETRPAWFGRVPFRPSRISVEILVKDG